MPTAAVPPAPRSYDHIARTDWEARTGDTCPSCGTCRFVRVKSPSGALLTMCAVVCWQHSSSAFVRVQMWLSYPPLLTCSPPHPTCHLLPTCHLQTFYDLGLANVIRDRLFVDPEFAAARGKGRDFSSGSLYGAAEAQRINRVTNGKLYHPGAPQHSLPTTIITQRAGWGLSGWLAAQCAHIVCQSDPARLVFRQQRIRAWI